MAMLHHTRTRLARIACRVLGVRAARRLCRDQQGVAAIEFSLVAAPFLMLLFAITETALVFFAGQTLETAAADSARLIMTGQAQSQGFDKEKFKQAMCDKMYGLLKCDGVTVDVKKFPTFTTIDLKNPIGQDGKFSDQDFGYQPGDAGDVVVVRIFYQWPVYLSLFGFNLADLPDSKRLLSATAAFRNEPFN